MPSRSKQSLVSWAQFEQTPYMVAFNRCIKRGGSSSACRDEASRTHKILRRNLSLGGLGMAAAARRRLPRSQFGLPSQRKYPLDTCGRTTSAKAYATQMYNKGYISRAQKNKIHARAERAARRLCG